MEHIKPLGTHLIIDIKNADRLDDIPFIEDVFNQCIAYCDAQLLNHYLHHFGEGHGITGVYLLAESHMSIHTWPEKRYAAVDIFLCGDHNPYYALDVLKEKFVGSEFVVKEYLRH